MLVGHTDTLKELKRLADAGELSHGYVFWGPAMIGKCLAAKSLAQYLESGEAESSAMLQDFLLISPVGSGTIGIDQVREIKNFLWQKPSQSSRRTLIIDDAHAMTTEAQNAILKITEEPPASSLIILVTSDPDALNPTVFSRLQKIYFSPVPQNELSAWAGKMFKKEKNLKDMLPKALGRPGLLHALLTDEDFAESITVAEDLMLMSSDKRKALLKKLMDRDAFDFGKLLDALILIASWEFLEKKKSSLWHRLLELRHESAYFNLNPRLQIESLFSEKKSALA